jgi:hypothetical protein
MIVSLFLSLSFLPLNMEDWMKNDAELISEFFGRFADELRVLSADGGPWDSFPFEFHRKSLIPLKEEGSHAFCLNANHRDMTYALDEHGNATSLSLAGESIQELAPLLFDAIEKTTNALFHYCGLCSSKDTFVQCAFKLYDGPTLQFVHPVLQVGKGCYLGIYVTWAGPGGWNYAWKKIE